MSSLQGFQLLVLVLLASAFREYCLNLGRRLDEVIQALMGLALIKLPISVDFPPPPRHTKSQTPNSVELGLGLNKETPVN